jgi:hypothetical protein
MKNEKQPKRLGRFAGALGAAVLLVASAGQFANIEPARAQAPDLGTSTPSEAAGTPNPEISSFTPRETREGWNRTEMDLLDGSRIEIDFKQLPSLGEDVLNVGTIASGDVKLDGKKLYDDDATTGSILLNRKEGARIKATYGASMVENYDPAYESRIMQTLSGQMDEDGCGLSNGCDTVKQQVYEEDGSVHSYDASAKPTAEPSLAPTNPDEIQKYVETNPNMDPSAALKMLDTLLANGFDVNAPENQDTLQALIDCVCKADGSCPVPGPTETPAPTNTPRPTATPRPTEVPCPDFKDIEKPYGGWKPENAPIVTEKVANAIFQADGEVDGVKRYDDDGSTALITVVETTKAGKHSFRYDYGGDLQPFCVTPEGNNQLKEVLSKDIAQTLARPDINKVRVVTITDNGVKSKWINE